MKKWLRETARDLLALGSIPFYFLVVVRSAIGKYDIFVYHMIIAAFAAFVLYFIIQDSNMHVARALITFISTSLFYKEAIFTFFAGVIFILILAAAYYLKKNFGPVARGVVIGILGSLAGYYLTLSLK